MAESFVMFRHAGPATVGAVFFGAAIAIAFFKGWRSGAKLFSDFNAGLFSELVLARTGLQFFSFFLMVYCPTLLISRSCDSGLGSSTSLVRSGLWGMRLNERIDWRDVIVLRFRFQLAFSSIFGFYSTWVMDQEYCFAVSSSSFSLMLCVYN